MLGVVQRFIEEVFLEVPSEIMWWDKANSRSPADETHLWVWEEGERGMEVGIFWPHPLSGAGSFPKQSNPWWLGGCKLILEIGIVREMWAVVPTICQCRHVVLTSPEFTNPITESLYVWPPLPIPHLAVLWQPPICSLYLWQLSNFLSCGFKGSHSIFLYSTLCFSIFIIKKRG